MLLHRQILSFAMNQQYFSVPEYENWSHDNKCGKMNFLVDIKCPFDSLLTFDKSENLNKTHYKNVFTNINSLKPNY